MNKFRVYGVLVLVFLIGCAVGGAWDYPYRLALRYFYQERYSELVFKCDEAMRQNFIAKARAVKAPTEQNAGLLRASDISLIDCHDYDNFRKRLGSLGLTQDELGLMGLTAIEHKAADTRDLVRFHEVRY